MQTKGNINSLKIHFATFRLKRMMEDEMFVFTEQMKTDFERQQESKLDEMRQRVKALKDKRLEEERKFVEKKLDLAFQ